MIEKVRSGTNTFHGTAYEYNRNTALNATQWGVGQKPKDIENDFGANFGGPAKLPGLWGSNHKTYFFFNFEGFRQLGALVTVGSGGSGTPRITATPTLAGSSEAISVSGGPGNPNDWVGLYRVGSSSDNEHLLAWGYLNGTQVAPPTGTSSATFTFVMPSNLSSLSAGLYEFRFFAKDDFKAPLAASQPIRVGSGPQLHSAP
jgi:hypothetical protein